MASTVAYYGAMGAGNRGAKGAKDIAMKAVIPVTRMCFGYLQEPPGGWYGPFGFLRLVAYFFVLVFLYACLALVYHIALEGARDTKSIALEGLLAVAAVFCAICAWSHEQLMNQTHETNKQNKRYTKSLEKLESAVKDFTGARTNLQDLAKKFEMDVGRVNDLVEHMAYFADIDSVCDLLKHFMAADRNKDRVCIGLEDGEELNIFVESARLAIGKVPGFEKGLGRQEISDVYRRNKNCGVDIGMVKLLANSMICSHDEPERAEALKDLFLFCMEPQSDARKDAVMEHKKLLSQIKHQLPHGSLQNALKDLADKTGYGAPCVSHNDLKPVAEVFIFGKLYTKKRDARKTISMDAGVGGPGTGGRLSQETRTTLASARNSDAMGSEAV